MMEDYPDFEGLSAFDISQFVTLPTVPVVVTFDKVGQQVIYTTVVILGLAAIATAIIATRD